MYLLRSSTESNWYFGIIELVNHFINNNLFAVAVSLFLAFKAKTIKYKVDANKKLTQFLVRNKTLEKRHVKNGFSILPYKVFNL